MKMILKYGLFVLLFVSSFSLVGAQNSKPGDNIQDKKVIRGYKETSILDMVLIYQGGVQRKDWTMDEMRPYVVHQNRFGKKDWFFDGFLFLEFQDGKEYNYSPGYSGRKPARKQEWEWLIDRHFEDGKAIKSLNACVEEATGELGQPAFKHRVVIGLPEPFLDQKDWGSIDGVAMDFSKSEDRIKASQWYIDRLIEKFAQSKLDHLELAGFYWVSEQTTGNNFITVDIGNYIRQKGKMFYWIPYYMSNGFTQWKDFGFDVAYLQPNYFFDKKVEDQRLDNACRLAYTYNMGLEMEFDGRALADNKDQHRIRLVEYIRAFERNQIFRDAAIAYYEGGGSVLALSKSANPLDKEILDTLAYLVKERRYNILESLLYEKDFKKKQGLDTQHWTVTGNKNNVKATIDGLLVYSGGDTTVLQTKNKINLAGGRVEIRAKVLQPDKNTKIRISLLPVEEKLGPWPASGELFLMSYDGNKPSAFRVGANTDKMNQKIGNARESIFYIDNHPADFHTFVCDWSEKKINFYVDSWLANVQEDGYSKIYSTYPNYWPFNEPFYLKISVVSPSPKTAVCIESVKINKDME